MDRDEEVHRLSVRLRTLSRYSLDLCLGRVVGTDGETLYIGRLGLTGGDGQRLLVDWRSPAAEPFFGATHARPMGLASRRRYRWTRGRITDYWDEVFTPDGLEGHAALDDQSAFIATLGSSRSAQMRDVLGTIQADQDAIIRAGSRGALVVDGGPGHRQDRRRAAPHGVPPLLRPSPRRSPWRCALRRPAPALPHLRRRRPAQPRRGGRADLHAPGPAARGGDGGARARSGRRPAEVVGRHGPGDRAGRPVVRGAAHRRHGGRDALGRRLAQRERLGRGLRDTGTRHAAQRGPRRGLGGAAHDPRGQARGGRGRLPRPRTPIAARRTPTWPPPSTGRGRSSRRRTSSATCGRCRPTCACARPGSLPRRSAPCSARTLASGPCPTCRSSTRPAGASATRRPRGDGVDTRRPSPPRGRGWTGSSTSSCSSTTRRGSWRS